MRSNTLKRLFPAALFLVVFIGVSFLCINEPLKTRRSEYRSTELKQVVTKVGNIIRTDYFDDDGNLRIAANVGYATKLVVQKGNSELETFLDDQGKQISLYAGYYGILREYDNAGNNVRITYLDKNNKPVASHKYAIEDRTFNESGQIVDCRYLDAEGNPALSDNNCFGVQYEYNEKGRRVRVTYLNETGEPMVLPLGYSSIIREYYETEGSENGKVKKEFYFLPDEKPASLSLGQYGIYKEYDENGQTSCVTYLDADGSPMVTSKGYTSIIYTHYADNSVQSTLYYDIYGNPFRMSEGQYGIKNKDGQTVYLNADGTEKFNVKNFIYNESRFVIVIAIILVIISAIAGEKLNWLMLFAYIGVIVYFTLMYRETSESKMGVFHSYRNIFASAVVRADILKNIWLFIPLGTILFRLFPQKAILFVPIFISIVIELIQYLTGMGMCELDDVISNGLGGTIGYVFGCLVKMISEKYYHRRSKQWRWKL